jgi:hypothetical protein
VDLTFRSSDQGEDENKQTNAAPAVRVGTVMDVRRRHFEATLAALSLGSNGGRPRVTPAHLYALEVLDIRAKLYTISWTRAGASRV